MIDCHPSDGRKSFVDLPALSSGQAPFRRDAIP
jgi:hypothetical protein